MAELFRKLACVLRGHDWTPWEYQKADACLQNRTCTRDGKEETRTEHVPGEWKYTHQSKCDQVKICGRCGVCLENRITHDFGDWHFLREGVCNQTRRCSRCEFEESRTKHAFEDTGRGHEVTITPPGTDWQMRYKATMLRCRKCGELKRHLLGAA